jgi:hypothetical protein
MCSRKSRHYPQRPYKGRRIRLCTGSTHYFTGIHSTCHGLPVRNSKSIHHIPFWRPNTQETPDPRPNFHHPRTKQVSQRSNRHSTVPGPGLRILSLPNTIPNIGTTIKLPTSPHTNYEVRLRQSIQKNTLRRNLFPPLCFGL